MGWFLVDRDTQEFVVAAQWYRWEATGSAIHGRSDINFWELRAAKALLAAVAALRVGRLGEVAACEYFCNSLYSKEKAV